MPRPWHVWQLVATGWLLCCIGSAQQVVCWLVFMCSRASRREREHRICGSTEYSIHTTAVNIKLAVIINYS
jgi:hypothetical protein